MADWGGIVDSLREAGPAALVVHSLDPLEVSAVMVIGGEGGREFGTMLEQSLPGLESLVRQWIGPGQREAAGKPVLQHALAGGWLLVSSSRERLAALQQSIPAEGPGELQMLGYSRRFKRTMQGLEQPERDPPDLLLFGNPVPLSKIFYPEMSEEVRRSWRFDELAGLGAVLRLAEGPVRDDRPSARIEISVPFTSPRTGFGESLLSYRPIERLPDIPFEFESLDATAFDPLQMHEIKCRMNDEALGEGVWLQQREERARRFGWDYLRDEMPRSNMYTVCWVRDRERDRLQFVLVDRVHDAGAMARYCEAEMASIRRSGTGDPDGISIREYRHRQGVFFHGLGPEDRQAAGQAGDSPVMPDLEGEQDSPLPGSGWYYDHRWRIEGPAWAVLKQLEALESDRGPSATSRWINRQIEALGPGQPLIRVRMERLEQRLPGRAETNRILEKYRKDREKRDELFQRIPNEDGYRLEIESEEDCRAVVQTLSVRAFGRRLGNALFLYLNEPSRLHVVGSLRPLADEGVLPNPGAGKGQHP